MKTFARCGLFLGILFNLVLAQASTPNLQRSSKVIVSTLNLKWFGIGGYMWNEPEQEFRHENIKKFIDQELPTSEILVFTEVVKTETLKDIIKDRFECATYLGTWSRHQHVMICFDKNKYRAEKYDNDFIIEEVDLGSGGLRPAAQAKICSKNGDCFLQIIGVHLAAGNKTSKRLEQVGHIQANLAKQDSILPTIITGDFNSYITEQSGLPEDDIDLFEQTLSKQTKIFKSVTRHIPTYNSGEWARAYDHIVASEDIQTLSTWGYEACKKQPDLSKLFIPYGSFRKHYTDHCPVSAEILVKH